MNASETCESIDRPDLEELNTSEYIAPFFLGTIHILRKHIFRIFGPPSPLCKHGFSSENKQK